MCKEISMVKLPVIGDVVISPHDKFKGNNGVDKFDLLECTGDEVSQDNHPTLFNLVGSGDKTDNTFGEVSVYDIKSTSAEFRDAFLWRDGDRVFSWRTYLYELTGAGYKSICFPFGEVSQSIAGGAYCKSLDRFYFLALDGSVFYWNFADETFSEVKSTPLSIAYGAGSYAYSMTINADASIISIFGRNSDGVCRLSVSYDDGDSWIDKIDLPGLFGNAWDGSLPIALLGLEKWIVNGYNWIATTENGGENWIIHTTDFTYRQNNCYNVLSNAYAGMLTESSKDCAIVIVDEGVTTNYTTVRDSYFLSAEPNSTNIWAHGADASIDIAYRECIYGDNLGDVIEVAYTDFGETYEGGCSTKCLHNGGGVDFGWMTHNYSRNKVLLFNLKFLTGNFLPKLTPKDIRIPYKIIADLTE